MLKKKNGYTLISLLVTATIIIILSSLSVANFRVGQRANELEIAIKDLTSVLRDLQLKSFTGELTNLPACTQDPPEGGYGFSASACNSPTCQYNIFAECVTPPDNDFTDSSEEIDVVNFSPNITVSFYKCPGGACEASPYINLGVSVTFDLYQQAIVIHRSSDDDEIVDEEFHIRLTHTVSGKTQDIIIIPQTGSISY